MRLTIRTITHLMLAMGAIFLIASAATASTPDGQTPAEETVCNDYSGAAFGLCNAYCEAMDCELLDDGDAYTSPRASVTACERVKENFIMITGETALPCDCPAGAGHFGCPCTQDIDCDASQGLVCTDNICDEGSNTEA